MSWASSTSCPPQYGLYETDICGRQTLVGCAKTGMIDVAFNGVPQWVRVWFNQGTPDNSVVMQYSDPARLFLGENASPQFDLDYGAWLATQPTSPPLCFDGGH
jgi:hypothetical protein